METCQVEHLFLSLGSATCNECDNPWSRPQHDIRVGSFDIRGWGREVFFLTRFFSLLCTTSYFLMKDSYIFHNVHERKTEKPLIFISSLAAIKSCYVAVSPFTIFL